MNSRAARFAGAILTVLIGCAALPALATPPADLQYFVGTWHCGPEKWTFAPFGSGWVKIEYGHGQVIDGIAYAGYVSQLGKYIYRDFHSDGGYADLTSPPPTPAGAWTWEGPYYAVGSAETLLGVIAYEEAGPATFTRSFGKRESGGSVTHQGSDTCTKDP
jgi:hypothetical protein